MKASPEGFELLLHTLVQHVLCILGYKLLHKKRNTNSVTGKFLFPNGDCTFVLLFFAKYVVLLELDDVAVTLIFNAEQPIGLIHLY